VVWVAMSDEDMAHGENIFPQTEEASSACVDEDSVAFSEINKEARPAPF
jgi:hypothetical protein